MKMTLPRKTGLVVAVDTETSGLYVDDGARISIVSAAWRDGSGALVSGAWPFDQGASDKPGQQPSLLEPDINLPAGEFVRLMAWLSKQRLVFHNAYFDLLMLNAGLRRTGGGVDLQEQTIWDTQIGQWVLDPLESPSLKPTAARLWGEDEKAEQDAIMPLLKRNRKRYDLLPWAVVGPYASKDAELTYRLREYQQERLAEGEEHLVPVIEQELAVMRTLVRMNYRGIGFDVSRSKVEGAKAKAMMNQIDAALPFSPSTPVQARKWFFEKCKAIPHCTTNGNLPSVGECCVRSLIAQQVSGAAEYMTKTKLTNAIGKYYDGYADATGEDGRLRTDFKQAGTVTMRFSSRRVNLQAMPHDYKMDLLEGIVPPRALFRPKEGHELWEFDLAQAEARVAAKLAGQQEWLEMFDAGNRDLHAETTDRLFGDHGFEKRQIAKRANFSLIYGVGPATFAKTVEKFTGIKLLDSQAREIVGDWNALYPEFKKIGKRAEQAAIRRGYVRLMDGRQRWFTPFDEKHKAFNAVVQGSIGQFTKRWMVAVDEACGGVLLQIHDSLVVELLAEDVDRWTQWISDNSGWMATEFFGVPMFVESKRWMTLADGLVLPASAGVG